ncbi:sigma-54-dependent transcriptional regulator [Aliikangiella sp. IMCC44653]
MPINPVNILLVEDEAEQRELIKQALSRHGFLVDDCGRAEVAIQKLKQTAYSVVISDWKLPEQSGESILEFIKANTPQTAFILITAHSDPSHAIKLIRAGADDYLAKPFDLSSLVFSINKQLYISEVEQQNAVLKSQNNQRDRLVDMIGDSEAMNKIYQRIEKTAATHATILISGESGTGKELAARAIHKLSERFEQSFIAVNCAAIPESLAEAELFGAEKGAYTGANKVRIGSIEAADGGTLFLDEIGELPLLMQSKILRFLQEGCITRIGSNKEIQLNVRVIAATNRNLTEEIKAQRFREDLYYRLSVIPIHMPRLSERSEDLPSLIQFFIEDACRKYQRPTVTIAKAALKALLSYSWPGNVRQLKNTLERLVILANQNQIELADFEELNLTQQPISTDFTLPKEGLDWEAHERSCLQQALEMCHQNKTKAANLLGMSYKAFLYRLEKYRIS